MRIIAGTARSLPLKTIDGIDTRPTTDRIKETLFNMLQNEVPSANFLDLFAGSGQIGLEAISRGAKRAVFVEMDRNAIEVIKKNIKTCNFADEAEVYQDDVFARIKWFQKTGQKFDIIYLDPPFTVESIFVPVMEALDEADILAQDGCIAIRSLKEKEMPEEFKNLYKYKKKVYGISAIHFYRAYED